MTNKRLILILFSLIILKNAVFGGKYHSHTDSLKAHYLSITPYLSYYKHLDFQNSPIEYKGPLAGIGVAFEANTSKYKYDLSFNGSYGKIKGETNTAIYSATQINSELRFCYLKRLSPDKRFLNWYSGAGIFGALNYHNNPSLQNASLSLTALTNFSFVNEFEKTFSWKAKKLKIWFLKINRRNRQLKVNIMFNLPLYFLNYRPGFSNISDFTNGENLWDLEAKHFGIFNNAFRLNCKTSLTYFLNNRNAFRLSYNWDTFRFEDTFDSYQAAFHRLEFSILFRFN